MRNAIAMCTLALLALCLPLAGCEGDDGGNGSGSASNGSGTTASGQGREDGGEGSADDAPSIDKAEFVEQANEICKRTSGKLAAEITAIASREEAKPGFNRTKLQTTLVTDALIPGLESEIEEISAAGTPDEGAGEAEAFLREMRKLTAKAQANPKSITEASRPYESVEVAGTRYGISECPLTTVSPE